MTRQSHQAKQAVLLLLSSLMLAVGGCASDADKVRAELDEELQVEEIDDGVYMIVASIHGEAAGMGLTSVMKQHVIKKAREHCAQDNKAIKLVSREGKSGSSSSSMGSLGGGGLFGMNVSQSASGSNFDIVFKCRERTTKAAP